MSVLTNGDAYAHARPMPSLPPEFDSLQSGRRYIPHSGAYAQSKLSDLIFAFELHRRLSAANSCVGSIPVHPGWALNRHRAVRELRFSYPDEAWNKCADKVFVIGRRNGGISMVVQQNVQIVKDVYAAFSRGDMQGLLALLTEDIEWITPGEGWPLAGTYRGRAGVAGLLQKASEMLEISFLEPREFVGQGDRLLVVGFERGRVKATNRTIRGTLGHGLYRPEWQSDGRPGV
jgi:uncharacterized protein